ncbi:MAG: sodium-independent anion transporter, partial [Desulfobacterales bacterium]|nr:sodium-independent anion transporter [Desulfobacterales bacterium]
ELFVFQLIQSPEHVLERLDEYSQPVKFLLLDFKTVSFMDLTGIEELKNLKDELHHRNIEFVFMDVHLPVKSCLSIQDSIKKLIKDFFIDIGKDAIGSLLQHIV